MAYDGDIYEIGWARVLEATNSSETRYPSKRCGAVTGGEIGMLEISPTGKRARGLFLESGANSEKPRVGLV